MAFLSFTIASFAVDVNPVFGFKQQKSVEGYKQYVGQYILTRPAYGMSETWKKTGWKYSKLYSDEMLLITDVRSKVVDIEGHNIRKVTFTLFDSTVNSKFNISGYEIPEDAPASSEIMANLPLVDHLPVLFLVDFTKYKERHIGDTIRHRLVKDAYIVKNIDINAPKSKYSPTASIMYELYNLRTGQTFTCPEDEVYTAPFKAALEHSANPILVKVEKPSDTSSRYGAITTVTDEGIDKYSYSDSLLTLSIFGVRDKFVFTLNNKSDHSLRIIWDDACFVGVDGVMSKVMHLGTAYDNRDRHQPATTIIKGATLSDCALPVNNVYCIKGKNVVTTTAESHSIASASSSTSSSFLGIIGSTLSSFASSSLRMTTRYETVDDEWKTYDMVPYLYDMSRKSQLRLMLPIEVNGVVNEYTFTFDVAILYHHPELLRL